MVYKFTKSSEQVIEYATEVAKNLGDKILKTEYVLYGLVKENTGVAGKALRSQNINYYSIFDMIIKINEYKYSKNSFNMENLKNNNLKINNEKKVIKSKKNYLDYDFKMKNILDNAYLEAEKFGFKYIETEHILLALMKEIDSKAVRILIELKVNPRILYNEIINLISLNESDESDNNTIMDSYQNTPVLNQYCVDLTKKAMDNKIDEVIGRKEEINDIVQVLSRRQKNNPCLIGEPGVRKNRNC